MRNTTIPAYLRDRPRDSRGYPITYVTKVTSDGKPHFAVTEFASVLNAAQKYLCHLCGKKMELGRYWFVGGPLSASRFGAYSDGPMHKMCAMYALRVCPFIAMPNYGKRSEGATLDQLKYKEEVAVIADPTMIPDRPEVFILSCAKNYDYAVMGAVVRFVPKKPFRVTQYWQDGKPIHFDVGERIAKQKVEEYELSKQ